MAESCGPISRRRHQMSTDYGWTGATSRIRRVWADFRQCGAQPVSDGRDTPALLARDSQGAPRWFRACGQVYPLEQRAPNASGTYCTSWTRPSS
jgi:hypothetical protein